MSRPLGLSQQDYDELENPSRAAEPVSHAEPLTRWEKCLFVPCCVAMVTIVFLLWVATLAYRLVRGKWPESGPLACS